MLYTYHLYHIDLVAHVLASAALFYLFMDWLPKKRVALFVAVYLTLLIGLGKEVYDHFNYGVVSILDTLANIVGVKLGVMLYKLRRRE